jgi:hypothetical protein
LALGALVPHMCRLTGGQPTGLEYARDVGAVDADVCMLCADRDPGAANTLCTQMARHSEEESTEPVRAIIGGRLSESVTTIRKSFRRVVRCP